MKHPCSLYLEHDLIVLLETRARAENISKSYLANMIFENALVPGSTDDPAESAKAALHPAQLATEAAERMGFLVQPASDLAITGVAEPEAKPLQSPREATLARMRAFLETSKETCQHPTEYHEMRGQVRMCQVCGMEVE